MGPFHPVKEPFLLEACSGAGDTGPPRGPAGNPRGRLRSPRGDRGVGYWTPPGHRGFGGTPRSHPVWR